MKAKYLSALAALAILAACGSKTEATDAEAPAPATEEAAPAPAPAVYNPYDSVPYVTTESGLKYKVIEEGTGKTPSATDVVTVNYEGRLLNGTVFDSSWESGAPITYPLNGFIPGWIEGLQLMKEGATYVFYIPYNLAYGEAGAGGVIPPRADLIFKVELIKVGE